MLFLLSICCITSWTINIVLLYIQGKQVLCKRQREQNRDGVLQPCGEAIGWADTWTDIAWIDPHALMKLWFSMSQQYKGLEDEQKSDGYIEQGGNTQKWIREKKQKEWEEEAIERRAAEKEQQSLCLFVRPSSRDKKRFSAEALHLSLFVLFILSFSSKPWGSLNAATTEIFTYKVNHLKCSDSQQFDSGESQISPVGNKKHWDRRV